VQYPVLSELVTKSVVMLGKEVVFLKNAETKTGRLYLVGTPLGNMDDFSPRAAETLRNVDFIAAEDTRVTLKILRRFGIKKFMFSCREHNIREQSMAIAQRLMSGENGAIVTDAGMPCISDPGEEVVRVCSEYGIEVAAVPGASAVTTAVALSGISAKRFCFEGFLSVNKKQRMLRLREIKDLPHTIVFYEAPHKLPRTLNDISEVFGDRKIALCREMTKLHEEVIRGTVSEMAARFGGMDTPAPKGEFVLVISGALPKTETVAIETAAEKALRLLSEGEKLTEVCKKVSSEYNISKRILYNKLQKAKLR
jgi:16S rRNA (cytidine1402-2'-O)-methyltransferase